LRRHIPLQKASQKLNENGIIDGCSGIPDGNQENITKVDFNWKKS
jgi:hypothetical protein